MFSCPRLHRADFILMLNKPYCYKKIEADMLKNAIESAIFILIHVNADMTLGAVVKKVIT